MAVLVRPHGMGPGTIRPESPHVKSVGTRTFTSADRPDDMQSKFRPGMTFHGLTGGCEYSIAAIHKTGYRPEFNEREVYQDDDGNYWIFNGYHESDTYDAWFPVRPCLQCGESQLEQILASRLEWEQDGTCFGSAHPGFFPGSTYQEKQAAQRMCEGCPVLDRCRDYALGLEKEMPGGYTGYLGGTTRNGRLRILAGE